MVAGAIFLLFVGCGNSNNDSSSIVAVNKFFGVNRDCVGIIKGKVISFYQNQGENRFILNNENSFKIPDDAKDVFMGWEQVGILRKDGRVDFYEYIAPRTWEINNKYSFTVSKEYERVMWVETDILGFVKGNSIDFFKKGRLNVELPKFTAPADAKSFFMVLSGVAVERGNGLDLYTLDEARIWTVKPERRFEFPADMKGLLPLKIDVCFGIIKDKTIDFFSLTDNVQSRRMTTFVIP
jgi:hypothetical protein